MLRTVTIALAVALAATAPARAEGPKEHVVEVISDYDNLRMYFRPKMLHVEPGDTVTWINKAAEDHNIVSYPDGYPKGAQPMNSPFLKDKDESWSFTFTVAGTYEYHCIPHLPMGMHGAVIVAHPSKADEFHEPTSQEMKTYAARLRAYFDEEEFQYKTRKERLAGREGGAARKSSSSHH